VSDYETRWFAAIWRDGEPPRWELRPFHEDDLVLAARHARDAGFQWSETYLLQVLAGPTPAGHQMIEQLARVTDGGVWQPLEGTALEVELRRQLAELQIKLRDNELSAEGLAAQLKAANERIAELEAIRRGASVPDLDAAKSWLAKVAPVEHDKIAARIDAGGEPLDVLGEWAGELAVSAHLAGQSLAEEGRP